MAEEGASLSSGSLQLYALPYGCVNLYNYDPLNKRAAVGIMVATEYRRQGYALAMLKELERMFSGQWSVVSGEQRDENGERGCRTRKSPHSSLSTLHSLYADIAAINTASLALFRKAGYVECGHFKEWLELDSHFIDNIRMQLILK